MIELVGRRLKMHPNVAREVLDGVFDVVKAQVALGRRVQVPGFGAFWHKRVSGRDCRVNGRRFRVEPHAVPSFRPSDPFREAVRHLEK
jgi:nucleoid DNA-binding protein